MFKIFPVLALFVLLPACSNDVILTWEPELPAEKAMREQVERLQTTTGQGVLVGAAGGALIGALLAGGEGAARGAQIGRFSGAGAGNYVRSLQARFATQEEVLDQAVRDVQSANATLEQSIIVMRQLLVKRQASLAEARRLKSSAGLARVTARADRNLSEMNKAVRVAESQRDLFGAARLLLIDNGPIVEGRALNDEITQLALQVRAMRKIADTLANDL